jgi:hypothetical protein
MHQCSSSYFESVSSSIMTIPNHQPSSRSVEQRSASKPTVGDTLDSNSSLILSSSSNKRLKSSTNSDHGKQGVTQHTKVRHIWTRILVVWNRASRHCMFSGICYLVLSTLTAYLVSVCVLKNGRSILDVNDVSEFLGWLASQCPRPIVQSYAAWKSWMSGNPDSLMIDHSGSESAFEILSSAQDHFLAATHASLMLSTIPVKWNLVTFHISDLKNTMNCCTHLDHKDKFLSLLGSLTLSLDVTAEKLRKFSDNMDRSADQIAAHNLQALRRLRAMKDLNGHETSARLHRNLAQPVLRLLRTWKDGPLIVCSKLATKLESEAISLIHEAKSIRSAMLTVDQLIKEIRVIAWPDKEQRKKHSDRTFFALWHIVLDGLQVKAPLLSEPSRLQNSIESIDGLLGYGRVTWQLLTASLDDLNLVISGTNKLAAVVKVARLAKSNHGVDHAETRLDECIDTIERSYGKMNARRK